MAPRHLNKGIIYACIRRQSGAAFSHSQSLCINKSYNHAIRILLCHLPGIHNCYTQHHILLRHPLQTRTTRPRPTRAPIRLPHKLLRKSGRSQSRTYRIHELYQQSNPLLPLNRLFRALRQRPPHQPNVPRLPISRRLLAKTHNAIFRAR